MNRALPASIQQAYLTDPNFALAQELAKAGSSTSPVATPLEGFARVLQGAVGGYKRGQLENEYAKRGQDYNAALAKYLASPGMTMDQRVQGLASNQDTAPLAQQLMIEKLKGDMDAEKNQRLLASLGIGTPGMAPAVAPMGQPPMGQPPSQTEPAATQAVDPRALQAVAVTNPAIGNALINVQQLDMKRKEMDPQFKGDVAEREAAAKSTVARMDDYIKSGQSAQKQLNLINVAKKIPLDGGALAPAKAKADALAKAFGIDASGLLENATNAQSFTGIMQDMVLQKQIAQKGPQTEADAKRMEQTLANLGNTPEARQFLLDIGAAQLRREADYGRFLTDWFAERGTYKGAEKAWNEGAGGEPLPIEWEKYQGEPQPTPQQNRPPLDSFFRK